MIMKLNKKQIEIAKKHGWTICEREIKDATTFYQTLYHDGEMELLHKMQRAVDVEIDFCRNS